MPYPYFGYQWDPRGPRDYPEPDLRRGAGWNYGYPMTPETRVQWGLRNAKIRSRNMLSSAIRIQRWSRQYNKKTRRYNRVQRAAKLGFFDHIMKYKKPYKKRTAKYKPSWFHREYKKRKAAFVDPFDSSDKLN